MTVSLAMLRGFCAVAQDLNFRRAADQLSITQPALSNQIKTLEESVGAPLFVRTTRRVTLTAQGERLYTRTRRLLSELDAAIADVREAEAGTLEFVTFCCIPTIAAHVFPRIISRFKQMNRGVKIQMLDEPTSTMERRIHARDAEFGVGGGPLNTKGLAFIPLLEDPFVIVCRRDHELAERKRVSIDEALAFPLISLARGSNVRNSINTYFGRTGRVFEPAYELTHHYTVGAMIESGLGITFLPSHATVMMNESPALKVVQLDDRKFSRTVGLISRVGESLPPAANSFFSFTAEALRRMPASCGGSQRTSLK